MYGNWLLDLSIADCDIRLGCDMGVVIFIGGGGVGVGGGVMEGVIIWL